MLIESIIRRPQGTKVRIGDKEYHFAPREPGGPHVAIVGNPLHVDRLLKISEGYRRPDGRKKTTPVDETPVDPVEKTPVEKTVKPEWTQTKKEPDHAPWERMTFKSLKIFAEDQNIEYSATTSRNALLNKIKRHMNGNAR